MTLRQYGIPDNAALLIEIVDLKKFREEFDGVPCEKCAQIISFDRYNDHIQQCNK